MLALMLIQMLNSMHVRHIISRFLSTSLRNDQFIVSSSLIERQNTWFRWLIRKCVEFIANATVIRMYSDLRWQRRKRRKRRRRRRRQKRRRRILQIYLRKSLNVEDIWHLVWWNDFFLEACKSFRELAFESRCKRMIKTIEMCKDIAFFCMIEARSLLQISEHACDFH